MLPLNPNGLLRLVFVLDTQRGLFLQAAPHAEYFGFDANNGTHGGRGGEDGAYKEWAKRILAPYRFHLIDVDTQKVESLPVKGVDLFHVDGDHTERGVQHDLYLAYLCIHPKGCILIDDIDYIPEVKKGVEGWLACMRDSVTFEHLPSLRGEMLIRRRV